VVLRNQRTLSASGFARLARRDDETQQRYAEEEQRRQTRKDAAKLSLIDCEAPH